MGEELSKADRDLIREYRDYEEDGDSGGHKLTGLILRLSKLAGSSNHDRIEAWVSNQESLYRLNSPPIPSETKTEVSDPADTPGGIQYIEQAIVEAEAKKDPQKKEFFERLRDYYLEHRTQL